jgi:hypothetical protein
MIKKILNTRVAIAFAIPALAAAVLFHIYFDRMFPHVF